MRWSVRNLCQAFAIVVVVLVLCAHYVSQSHVRVPFSDKEIKYYPHSGLAPEGHHDATANIDAVSKAEKPAQLDQVIEKVSPQEITYYPHSGLSPEGQHEAAPNIDAVSKAEKPSSSDQVIEEVVPPADPTLHDVVTSETATGAQASTVSDIEIQPNASTHKIIQAILTPDGNLSSSLTCPTITTNRYDYLQFRTLEHKFQKSPYRKYFFALILSERAPELPRLLGTVVEAIRFLNPENCALSIVGNFNSTDGTAEVLQALGPELQALGAQYYFSFEEADIKGEDKNEVPILSDLRNQALLPLTQNRRGAYSLSDSRIIFLDEISLCPVDILEVLHQHTIQEMHIACAMDWSNNATTFSSANVSRTIDGEVFPNGNVSSSSLRYKAHLPIQLFSCWSPLTILAGEPFIRDKVAFRTSNTSTSSSNQTCHIPSPILLSADFQRQGLDHIAIIPSVNVGYTDEETKVVKEVHGSVEENLKGVEGAKTEGREGVAEIETWDVAGERVRCEDGMGERCVDLKDL